MKHLEESAVLSRTSHGSVKVCPTGCVHVTFGKVTLHFEDEEEFETMAQVIIAEAEACVDSDDSLEVRFEWFSMDLTRYGTREFAYLVGEAAEQLAWTRGDLEFTDLDLAEIRKHASP